MYRLTPGYGEIVAQILLLTGPEVIDVVSDIILIVFLIFALFALIVFMVMALLLYRRLTVLVNVLTKTVERSEHLLEELGNMTDMMKSGRILPGVSLGGAVGTVSALLGGILGLRRRHNDNDSQ